MPNPLSADIRARFEVLFAEGLTGREIGRRLMISAASASRLSQRLKRGLRLTPADNPRNTGHGRLGPYHGFLIELIHQDPDITLGSGPINPAALAQNPRNISGLARAGHSGSIPKRAEPLR